MSVVELSGAPGLPRLYGRALVGLLPGRRRSGDGAVPTTELVLRGVTVDQPRLAEYARVCGFRLADTLPATYPHLLAFPLALVLMTARDFPFPATSVVHLANRIELRAPLPVTARLDLSVSASGPWRHPRGRCVDVTALGSVDGQLVWRGVSTYLRRTGDRPAAGQPSADSAGSPPADSAGQPPADSAGSPGAAAGEPVVPSAIWRVGPADARAYAAVSGDRNPIHLSTVAARAFGFRRRLAHGMWTKARCLAQLTPRLPDSYAVEVRFRAPVLLPATVGFAAAEADDGVRFTVHGQESDRSHLTGDLRPLAAG